MVRSRLRIPADLNIEIQRRKIFPGKTGFGLVKMSVMQLPSLALKKEVLQEISIEALEQSHQSLAYLYQFKYIAFNNFPTELTNLLMGIE